MKNRMDTQLRSLVCVLLIVGSLTFGAQPSDEELGLHSGGKSWGFDSVPNAEKSLPHVLLIGDSIMNGYRREVSRLLAEKATVDKWSTSAHLNSRRLHSELREVLDHGTYDVIHFNIGLHGWSKGRVPEGQYETLMRAYVEILRTHSKNAKLVWATTTQIRLEDTPQLDPIHNQTIVKRNAIAEKVMAQYKIEINDLYGLMSHNLHLRTNDPFHWKSQGSKLQAQQVAEAIFSVMGGSDKRETIFFLSPDGDDTNPGTKVLPFKTLEKARDAIRRGRSKGEIKKESVVVFLRGGIYERQGTFELDERDSGTKESPVIWRAWSGEDVRIVGGRTLSASVAVPISDKLVRDRIVDEKAHSKVLQIDLRKFGIEDYGKLRPHGFRRPYVPAHLELFIDGNAMRLAQWPNPGQPRVPIGKIVDAGSIPREGDYSNRGGIFHYDTDRPGFWKRADNIWIFGFFLNGYADNTVKVKRFDFDNRTIETVQPHLYGFGSDKPWNSWYALNLLEEIDQPGEYYCDPKEGVLYFYPPAGFDPDKSIVQVSMLEEPMLAIEGVSYLRFERITFECSRGMGIYIERGRSCRIEGCTLRNLGVVGVCIGRGTKPLKQYVHDGTAEPAGRKLGSWHEHIYQNPAYDRHAGIDHGVISCDIYNIGAGAVSMGGGDRKTLSPACNFVRNCHLYNFNRLDKTYRAGINIDGVGNKIQHCLIHDCPNNAIYLHGNDHIIEYNEIHHAVMDADDMGAFYMGRDPSEYGNIIRYNYFHNNGPGQGIHKTQAIFFDDGACGTTVHGNIIYKTAGMAMKVNGGIDNIYTNNVLIDNPKCDPTDGWKGKRWHKYFGTKTGQGELNQRLRKHVDIFKPPYSTRYPELLRRYNANLDDWHGNFLKKNLAVRSGSIREDGEHRKDNWVTDSDPGFEDMANENFTLKSDAEVFKHIPDFELLPFEKMGLYQDSYRR